MSLQETPYGLTKVYVDYLPKSNVGLQEELEEFMGCGKIIKMLKKSGKTNGYLIFKKPNSVRVALRKDGVEFKGKKLRVELPKGITLEGKKKKDEKGRGRARVDPELQVYLSHLAKPVNEEIIRNIVSENTPHLTIERVKMMTGNRNSCFVTMKSKLDVSAFCAAYNGYPLLGMQLVAIPAEAPGVMKSGNPSTSAYDAEHHATRQQYEEEKRRNKKEEEEENWEQDEWQQQEQQQPKNHQVGTCQKVLVGVLPESVRTQDVKSIFASCGRVTHVHFFRNKVTGAPTGVASVKFDTPRSAGKALSLDGTTVSIGRGVKISVELDDNKEHLKEQDAVQEVVKKAAASGVRKQVCFAEEPTTKKTKKTKKPPQQQQQQQHTDSRKKIFTKTAKLDDDDDEVILSESEDEGVKEVKEVKRVTGKKRKMVEEPATKETKKKMKKIVKKKAVKQSLQAEDDEDAMVEEPATENSKNGGGVFDSVDLDMSDEEFLRKNPKLAAMREKFLKEDEDDEGAKKPKKRRVKK